MSDSVEKTFIGRKRFDNVNQDTAIPVQNENKKIKIAVGNKDTNFKAPEKLVHKSDLKSKDVNKTDENVGRKSSTILETKEEMLTFDKQDEISRKIEENKDTGNEVGTERFVTPLKKDEVLFRLILRRSRDDYYSAEVNAVIDYIVGKKDKLNEKLIDELSKKCLIEGCITEEDRKKEGDDIVEAARKWFEENNRTEMDTKKFISLVKKEKVLLYLKGHENGNSYSQSSSYSQEVREKITFVLSNKNLLDEESIDELCNACLMKACFNEEDRKRKGEAIVSVADKVLEKIKGKSDENEENTKNTQTVVAKTGKTEIAKRVPGDQKKMVEKIENNINAQPLTPKGDLDSGNMDNSKKRVSAVEEHGEASVAQEDWTDRNFAKSEVFSFAGSQQDFNFEGSN